MSAGSAFGSIINICLVGLIWGILGLCIDKSNFAFQNMSQDATNTIWFLYAAFGASIFLYFIAVVINHWIVSKNEANTGV